MTVNGGSLTLDVQPSATQTANPNQLLSYRITVRDPNGNGISGATVPVANPLTSNTSVTTGSGGTFNYSFTVPSGASSGNFTLTFGGASKSGYLTSALVQRTVTVNGPQPTLTLAVTPTALRR